MKHNYYDKLTQSTEQRIGMGNDVSKSGLLKKFTAPMLWQNTRLATFLTFIDLMLIGAIDSIKTIQYFNNFTISKNDKRYNQ